MIGDEEGIEGRKEGIDRRIERRKGRKAFIDLKEKPRRERRELS